VTSPDCAVYNAAELRVLLLVPTRKDAAVTARLLAENHVDSLVCESVGAAVTALKGGAGALVTTDEVLSSGRMSPLLELLGQQPEWSDLPLLVLMKGGVDSRQAAEVLDKLTNVTILERPAPLRSVLSAVQTALRGRRRQYEIRRQIKMIREAEAKALKADQAKDDFLAALSHELRTPLNPVLLLATDSAANPALPSEVRQNFELIAKNVDLEARLIDDLLDLTRITRGKLKLEKSLVRLSRIVADAIATVNPEFTDKNVALATDFDDGGALVNADSVRLQQVIWNVLRNAAKFTPPGGRVSVRTFRDSTLKRVAIVVTDSGIGMNDFELARVFDAFAQGDHASAASPHRFGGLGLGLAISRSLVALHDGEIQASSPGQNQGSVFTISLPISMPLGALKHASVPTPSAQSASPVSATHLRILLVEDHAPTRTALKHLLTRRRYDVECAGSVAEARDVAAHGTFDVLVTDIGLPDGSGYDLMEDFSRKYGLKGIALTGYGMEMDHQRSRNAGFIKHLTKPLTIQTLDAVLADLQPTRR